MKKNEYKFLIKISNNSQNNLIHVYKNSLIKELQYLFNLFGNNKVVNVNFLHDYKEVKNLLGYTVPKWVRAFTINDNVYILEYTKDYYINIDEFEKILVHEIVHALTNRKIKNCPLWLHEGLALILSKQYKNLKFENFTSNNLDNLSYEDNFFYEKCCAKTMKYFNKYNNKEFILNLIENKVEFPINSY